MHIQGGVGGMASTNNCSINAKDEYSEYFMHYTAYTESCIN